MKSVEKKLLKRFTIISLSIIIIDQITKYLIYLFKPNWTLNFLDIHLITNTGAGFGILKGNTNFLALISLLVTILLISYYQKIPKEKNIQVIFALLLGGTVGNLIDRIFRKKVIDFIDLNFWPAFNVADAAITISAIGLIWYYWKK